MFVRLVFTCDNSSQWAFTNPQAILRNYECLEDPGGCQHLKCWWGNDPTAGGISEC